MNDTDRTDVIPGLRSSDTPPMPLTLPASHRRRRRDVPRWAWVAIWGVPVAVAAGLVGWALGGTPHDNPPTSVASSPSPSHGSPGAVPPAPLPSTTDTSPRLRATHTAPAPPPTRDTSHRPSPSRTASPTPTRTASPAPSPTHTHDTGSPAPTDSDVPPIFTPPTITPEATDG